jgi:hypothetical protein
MAKRPREGLLIQPVETGRNARISPRVRRAAALHTEMLEALQRSSDAGALLDGELRGMDASERRGYYALVLAARRQR